MLTFSGSLLGGPELDLIGFSGLELSEVQREHLWDRTNAIDLLEACSSVAAVSLGEAHAMPGLGDEFFEYRVRDPEAFRKELRREILAALGKQR